MAITAAETGHLVFGTLHTSGAAKTINRIIDVFPSDQQTQIRMMLADSLRGVVSQSLLPTIDGQGRVAALELLVNTTAIANLIREGKNHLILSAMQTGAGQGMLRYDQYVEDLARKGKISRAQADDFLGKPSKQQRPAAAQRAPQRPMPPPAPVKPTPPENKGGLGFPFLNKKKGA